MGVGRRMQGGVAPLDFIHDTDKVEGGLMVLLISLGFQLPSRENFCSDTLVLKYLNGFYF